MIETPSATQPTSIELEQGERIGQTVIDVLLTGDDITEYPFDQHQATLFFTAARAHDASKQLPIRMSVDAGSHLWKFALEPQPSSTADAPKADLILERSGGTTFWVWFMIIAMWTLAVGVLAIAVRRARRPGPFGFLFLTWMASMMFALVSFRQAAPGDPPIGSLIDFAAFFWAEFLVATGLIITMIAVLGDNQNPDNK